MGHYFIFENSYEYIFAKNKFWTQWVINDKNFVSYQDEVMPIAINHSMRYLLGKIYQIKNQQKLL